MGNQPTNTRAPGEERHHTILPFVIIVLSILICLALFKSSLVTWVVTAAGAVIAFVFEKFLRQPEHPETKILLALIIGASLMTGCYFLNENEEDTSPALSSGTCGQYQDIYKAFRENHSLLRHPGRFDLPDGYQPPDMPHSDPQFKRLKAAEDQSIKSFVAQHCSTLVLAEKDNCANVAECLNPNYHLPVLQDIYPHYARQALKCKKITDLVNRIIRQGETGPLYDALADLGVDEDTDAIDVTLETMPVKNSNPQLFALLENPRLYLHNTNDRTMPTLKVTSMESTQRGKILQLHCIRP